MHEWALAEAIVETVKAKAFEWGRTRFSLLKVKLGELQQVDKEILSFALNELLNIAKDENGISVEKVIFVEEKAVAECLRCGYRWDLDTASLGEEIKEYIHFVPEVVHTFASCPRCGSTDFDIASGRGVSVELE